MCGIGGIVVPRRGEAAAAGLRRMGTCMDARGPDEEGLFVGPGVGLVNRRLSMLDLNELGNCPMPNEGSIVLAQLHRQFCCFQQG
jgi:asparagine synthase (glutamine-hydrolysing)